jgi:oxygen-dependent protoporphyrinogen oxidase
MKLTGMPGFARVTRYDRAIPQYTRGHLERMKALERAEKDNPGLLFAANYRGGIAVSDVVSSAASRVR